MASPSISNFDTVTWWAARRSRYNVGLLAAGLVALALAVAVIGGPCACEPDAEVTVFTTAFQAAGYLIAMAVANLCYQLGPLVERRLRPHNVARYRRLAFGAGFGVSVALPLLVPLLAYLGCHCGAPGQPR